MANQLAPTFEFQRKERPDAVRMIHLSNKYGNHSVIKRLESARRDDMSELDIYRPRSSALANTTTDELIELIRYLGCVVTQVPSGSVNTLLFRVSNLKVLVL